MLADRGILYIITITACTIAVMAAGTMCHAMVTGNEVALKQLGTFAGAAGGGGIFGFCAFAISAVLGRNKSQENGAQIDEIEDSE